MTELNIKNLTDDQIVHVLTQLIQKFAKKIERNDASIGLGLMIYLSYIIKQAPEFVEWAKSPHGKYKKGQGSFDLDDGTDKPNEGGCVDGWCGI